MSRNMLKKLGIGGGIILLILLFKLFELEQYLTLSYLKQSQANFAEIYSHHRLAVVAAYALLYIVVTALSLPGAAILTLAGGALFGLTVGALVVSFASSIGATLACFIARFLLRGWVQARFGDRLQVINAGMAREGGFYLFTLRLVPVFPFFMINLVMGLTTIRLSTFYWVSQLGMFPATLVFVNAGKELAKIDSLSGILSPGLLLSFIALGLFPLAMKKLVERRKVREEKSSEI